MKTRRRAPKPKPAPADPVRTARDAALKLLADRDLSRVELSALLAGKKHRPDTLTAAIDELVSLGLVDDRRVAASHIRARLEQGSTARALLEADLERRGIAQSLATEVLDDLLQSRDETRDALELARVKVRTAPARLAPEAVLRRAFAYLARRGYDEETARQAVETAGEEYLGRP